MKHRIMKAAPVLLLCGLLAPGKPAAAQGDSVNQIERQYGVVDRDSREGQRLNNELDDVVQRMVPAINARRGGHGFHLRSARLLGGRDPQHDKVVNAFALPDGRIYVTLGLMRAIQNDPNRDAELAFVVGHELTHVVEHHSAEQQKKALPVGIAAVLLGAVTHSSAVGGLANLGANAAISHYSRNDEYRADKGGLKAMYRAGYDPHAAVTMLNRLKALGGESHGPNWFGSHPLTGNRVDRMQEMIADLDGGREPRDRSSRDIDREDRNGDLRDRDTFGDRYDRDPYDRDR